ncbi:MAG: tRNA-dihydrouridine synthase, partial [Planctomycetes bacterium]|nr:tRNA-dihydrouridine synthase [Planctomycetota bacterium]
MRRLPLRDCGAPARLFLAPMAGYTDGAFRRLMHELGAEVVTSELISAKGFVHGSRKTRAFMKISDEERPVGLQI